MSNPFITTYSFDSKHAGDIFAVATSPKYTVAASGDGYISLWDNQKVSEEFVTLNQQPIKAGVHHLAINRAGDRLVAVSFDGHVHAYNLKTLEPLALTALKGVAGAWDCAVARSVAAISTLKGLTYVVDLDEDKLVAELKEPASSVDSGKQPCLCIDISSEATLVVAGFESGKIRVYSVETGLLVYTLPSYISRPRAVKFNPQDTMIAVGGSESIALFSLNGGSYLGSLEGHHSHVFDIAFEPQGERLLSVAGDGKAKVWSLETRQAVFNVTDSNFPLFSCAWVPERTNIISGVPVGFVTGGVDKVLRWYREASGRDDDVDAEVKN